MTSCNFQEKENQLKAKEMELNKREQELAIREAALISKEEKLKLQEQLIDSAQKTWDSVGIYNEVLIGDWAVTMNCTETSCEGSAIGDTKTEQWSIFYENNQVTVKSFFKKKLLRIYKGIYYNNTLKLTEENNTTDAQITIELAFDAKDTKKMKGTRTIIQPTCKIVYSLDVSKANAEKNITNILK